MWRSVILAAAVVLGLAVESEAQEKPLVVVELFTSQGCSSCPPADAFFGELAARADVLALGLHVDYWDYIGWKDVFGDRAYSERQRDYARFAGRRSVYTPQMIINGEDHIVGNHPQDVQDLVRKHQGQGDDVSVQATRRGGKAALTVSAKAGTTPREADVLLVRYMPRGVTEISRGENAGREIEYANIVTDIRPLGRWDMRAPLTLNVPLRGKDKAAIIVQAKGPGAVLGAARIN